VAIAQRNPKPSREQDRQMKDAYLFILAGEHNAASLAGKLGVSLPTASRLLEMLRKDLARRGKRLVSVRSEDGFHYEVRDDARLRRISRDPLVTLAIPARGARRDGLKAEDRDIYDGD
jgi:DNA-binding transcriptional regulator LsrR (DeoR family)